MNYVQAQHYYEAEKSDLAQLLIGGESWLIKGTIVLAATNWHSEDHLCLNFLMKFADETWRVQNLDSTRSSDGLTRE